MKLPSAEEFLEIVHQKNPASLSSLYNYHFLTGANGKAWSQKSRETIVFKAEYDSSQYAIRFFLHDDVELFRRYHEIQNYLQGLSVSWKVPFEFMDEEYFPVIKMNWVNGISFSEYLDNIILQPFLIEQLQTKLVLLSQSLEGNGVAHGNLNLKHILVAKNGSDYDLKLIDYDSMYIPSFRDKDSLSSGTSSFQHPMRLASDFSERIDRFSIWAFLTALEAFKVDPSLWIKAEQYGYDKSKQLLFNYRDLAFPQQSRAFQTIKRYNKDALNFYANKLIRFCNLKALDDIEAPHLFNKESSHFVSLDKREPKEPGNNFQHAKQKEINKVPETIALAPKEDNAVVAEKKIITKKDNEFVRPKPSPKEPKLDFLQGRKRKFAPVIIILAIVILALTSFYFLNTKHKPATAANQNQTTQKRVSTAAIQDQPSNRETFFTSTNITQFLFQLYQSYNKRDLQGILSNYRDSLNQYYDTYGVGKLELTGMIKNLFISPAYYECQPDIRTLQFNTQDSICKLTIGVNETIQANRRSKKENYSSKIEYAVDSSFKILSERNIQ